MYTFHDFLNTLFQVVIIPAIPIFLVFLRNWVTVSVQKKTAEIEQERLKNLINSAVKSVFTVVDATAQTYVDNMKQNDLFDKEAQKEAFRKAKYEALELITAEGRKAIRIVYGDVDVWLSSLIEQFVAAKKNGTGADALIALTA